MLLAICNSKIYEGAALLKKGPHWKLINPIVV